MSELKRWDSTLGQWVVVGPSEGTVGSVVYNGNNNAARPSMETVYWKGWPDTDTPTNSESGDFIFSPDSGGGGGGGGTGSLTHEALLAEHEGFAEGNIVGAGNGAIEIMVTNTNDSGAGSLRAAMETVGNRWIKFDPTVFSETANRVITLSSGIDCTDGKTIDGRGANVTIQSDIFWLNCDDVIVTNIKFDYSENYVYGQGKTALSIGFYDRPSGRRIWIHGCEFTGTNSTSGATGDPTDSCIDVMGDAANVTVSYCFFNFWDKAFLIGTDPADPAEWPDNITVHNCRFNYCSQRQPIVRGAHCHIFNNWYNEPRYTTSYAEVIIVQSQAEVLVENSIFDSSMYVEGIKVTDEGGGTGNVREDGNYASPDVDLQEFNPGSVSTPSYSYTLDPISTSTSRQALRDKLTAFAGWNFDGARS